MQQNYFRSLKETKRALFGPFWGPLKRGHFTPFRWGSEKGSKIEVFDGFKIYRYQIRYGLVGTE